MKVIDNRALLLTVKNPARITAVIPSSREFPNNRVLVKWGLDEAQVLKNLNIKNVPSPILGHYKWTGQHKPFNHQRTTASFLTLHRRAFCFSEQGTGKTGAVIWAADWLMMTKKIRRVLVICPLSIMDSAWRADLFKFAMHRRVDIAYGSAKKRKAIIESDAEFVIINYDGVEIVADTIAKANFDLIVIDEASAYKSTSTKRWKVLNGLLKPDTWLWMMTGTPAAQSPVDAYGLAKLVNPKGVPPFFSQFRDMVMSKVTNFRWEARPRAKDIVHQVLQPAIRYTKDECLDLPEMTYVRREVELTAQQQKYYTTLANRMTMVAAGEEITAVNKAVAMNKLLQIATGAVYSDTGEVLEFDISNRYRVLKEVIDEASQKVLVFVPFNHVIDLLVQKLEDDNISVGVINGAVSVGKRTQLVHDFQTKDIPRVMIIQPQAAQHGLTLTAANTVVWWGPTPSLETYEQCNARVHRAGQRHPSTVFMLQGSKVERRIYQLLSDRIDVYSDIMKLYEEPLV
jgi:SNF2 family DNA or RNA helicase